MLLWFIAPNPETPCSNKYYICPEDQRPIPRSYLCDTQTDCEPSASDETDCSTSASRYLDLTYTHQTLGGVHAYI